MHYLYRITNILNGKIYIGQTVDDKKRWSAHKSYAKHRPIRYVHRAMVKYGNENFVYEIIAVCRTPEDANETETQIILRYDSRNKNKGYNIASGGDTPWNLGLPKERNPLTGRSRSLETRRRISEGNVGKIMPPASDERKQKMSAMYRGRTLPPEWVEKIATSNRGQTRSEETRLNISVAHIGVQAGEKHPGAKLNWEKVENIRADFATGSWSYKQLSQKYGVSETTIRDVISHKTWKPSTK